MNDTHLHKSAPSWSRRAVLAAAAVGPILSIFQRARAADSWPSGDRPIRLIVPLGAGSVSDVQARPLGQILAKNLKHPVVVENRPGAAGAIGTDAVAKSAADGYTLLLGNIAAITVLPHLQRLPYDPLRDLLPITRVTSGPFVLLANPQAPFDSVVTMVEHGRKQPGALKVGAYSIGGAGHLTMLLIASATGADLTHVPYQGPQQVTDAIGGQIPLVLDFPAVVMPHVRAGKLRPLAVTGPRRYSSMPEVPTMAELGYPGVEAVAWQGIFAPAATPAPIVRRLSEELVKVLSSGELRDLYLTQGAEIGGDTPEQFAAFVRGEHERWGRVIRQHGVRLE